MGKRTRKELEQTAYHEAGHVVVLLSLRERFRSVTIVPNFAERSAGHVDTDIGLPVGWEYNGEPETERRIRNLGIHYFAGFMAQERHRAGDITTSDSDDRREAYARAAHLSGDADDTERLMQRWERRARRILLQPAAWRAVEAVAAALLRENTLAHGECERIYRNALGLERLQIR
jgi:hypothetical protein